MRILKSWQNVARDMQYSKKRANYFAEIKINVLTDLRHLIGWPQLRDGMSENTIAKGVPMNP